MSSQGSPSGSGGPVPGGCVALKPSVSQSRGDGPELHQERVVWLVLGVTASWVGGRGRLHSHGVPFKRCPRDDLGPGARAERLHGSPLLVGGSVLLAAARRPYSVPEWLK